MIIAYLGDKRGTSLQRANALERLGHQVHLIDIRHFLPNSAWIDRWLIRTGGFGISSFISKKLLHAVAQLRPDAVWVDSNGFLSPALLSSLKNLTGYLVSYMIDDPWSKIWHVRHRNYRKSLQHFSLCVVMRRSSVEHCLISQARKVYLVNQSADEVAHSPVKLDSRTEEEFASEVSFIGTWFEGRGAFIRDLLTYNVPVSIWGDRWERAPEWSSIKSVWRGPALKSPESYAAAIQCSKLSLGLLAKQVDDAKTSRTFEIPALGGLLCAERTSEHLKLYNEGTEAIFWGDALECASHCHQLLADDPRRQEIARKGRQRALQNQNFNEPILEDILATLHGAVGRFELFEASNIPTRS